MKLKPGVDVLGIKPELLLGLQVAEAVYARHGVELVVTSVTDGKHRRGSLHYQGLAADLRVHGLPGEREVREGVAREIGKALGVDYDAVYEGHGTPGAHVHLEYQRK
jgi:hypothetical protein